MSVGFLALICPLNFVVIVQEGGKSWDENDNTYRYQ